MYSFIICSLTYISIQIHHLSLFPPNVKLQFKYFHILQSFTLNLMESFETSIHRLNHTQDIKLHVDIRHFQTFSFPNWKPIGHSQTSEVYARFC